MSSRREIIILILILWMSMSVVLCYSDREMMEDDDMNLVWMEKGMKAKLSKFRVYWHDIPSGNPPSSIPIVKAVTKTGFGQVNMIDNPLTVGPELTSKAVGKAQGFYGLASQEELGLFMAMNFFFTTGKYNASSLAILGRNAVFDHVREMPVIGGSGLFRWARGYVQARTHSFNLNTGDATVEYTVYVMHY